MSRAVALAIAPRVAWYIASMPTLLPPSYRVDISVSRSTLIGRHPSRGVVSLDNSRLYVTNFGSDSVAVYDIDMGRRIATMPVGSRPDGLALTPDQNYLLVLDTQAGDVTVIQKRKPRKLEPTEYSLLTMIPVGMQPNGIVVKAFMMSKPVKK